MAPPERRLQGRAVGVADGDRERVGGVVGLRAAPASESSAPTMRCTCSLAAEPLPQTACLTAWGV